MSLTVSRGPPGFGAGKLNLTKGTGRAARMAPTDCGPQKTFHTPVPAFRRKPLCTGALCGHIHVKPIPQNVTHLPQEKLP